MKKHTIYFIPALILLLMQACTTPKYIHDESSLLRQQELRSCRSDNVFCDVMTGVGAVFLGAMLDADVDFYPSEQQFKKINLINTVGDTMYVNLLTDVYWDENNYCDFMDIRIPPKMRCKVMVPIDANYNLYFSTTPESNDDEMIEIFTNDIKKISLYPGLTVINNKTKKQLK